MSNIVINFTNVTLSAVSSEIQLTGGIYALDAGAGLSFSGTVAYSALFATNTMLSFNVNSGKPFNATVQAKVIGDDPTRSPAVAVTAFNGMATVTWPTANGLVTQLLTPGIPMTLTGYVE